MLYLETPSGFEAWAGQAIDGVLHPLTIEQHWATPELAAIGLCKPADAVPVPEGKVVASTGVQRIGGVVKFVHVLEDAPPPSTNPADYPLLPWQFKAMVMYLGKDAAIRIEINKITDSLQRAAAMARYEHASAYVYTDPMMQAMRIAIGLPEQEMVDAWMAAKDLRSA